MCKEIFNNVYEKIGNKQLPLRKSEAILVVVEDNSFYAVGFIQTTDKIHIYLNTWELN